MAVNISNLSSENGGFVAGTLVHAQEGLRPIEQIKVGDYVLSKHESGLGEPSYKRVSRTYEYDDKEAWFVRYEVLNNEYKKTKERGFFVATGNHPIWVEGFISNDGKFHKLNIWESTQDLAKDQYAYAHGAVLLLMDNRLAVIDWHGGLIANSDMPDMGIVNSLDGLGTILDSGEGLGIDFSGNFPIIYDYVELNSSDFETYPAHDAPEGSVGAMAFGFPPLLRKVYNLEVEENHTYYVGEFGIWVHDTHLS